jgi:aspartyl-tRNA(Asn)/glutamyl-tRNA(Gln) amidotransferase subunit A
MPVPSAVEVAEAVRRGQRSAVEVLDACLTEVAAIDDLNAFVHLDPEGARHAAEAVDAAVARGEDPGPLAGVPFGVKDLEDCAGMPTSHGSLLFKGRGPVPADSIHVARLRAAGAVPLGKTAAPEFGTLSFTKTKAWGVTRNPWDPSRTPGGSSGGSAAAVAAGAVPFATASDGGGSTRIPAAFAGLVGFKPSHGRIPHPGPSASETAVFGALTTTVADAARHLDVVAGPDDHDRWSLPAPTVRYEEAVEALAVSGLRARWSPDLGFATTDPEVEAVTRSAAEALADAAALAVDEAPVVLTDPVKTWLSAGALDLWLSIEEDMWPAGAEDLTAYSARTLRQTEEYPLRRYAAALRRRQVLQDDVARLFTEVDVLLLPTTAVPAFAAEGPPPDHIAGQPVGPAMATPFTMLANLCWNPAVSLPAGTSAEGLPIGLQVVGRRHADEVVLRLARIFETVRPWPRTAPAGS